MATASEWELSGRISRPQFTRVGGIALWTAIMDVITGLTGTPSLNVVIWGRNAELAASLPDGANLRCRGRFKTDRFLTAEGDFLQRTSFVIMQLLSSTTGSVGLDATASPAKPNAII